MKRILTTLALAALVLLPLAARADESQPKPAGTVISVSGKVTVITAKSSSRPFPQARAGALRR